MAPAPGNPTTAQMWHVRTCPQSTSPSFSIIMIVDCVRESSGNEVETNSQARQISRQIDEQLNCTPSSRSAHFCSNIPGCSYYGTLKLGHHRHEHSMRRATQRHLYRPCGIRDLAQLSRLSLPRCSPGNIANHPISLATHSCPFFPS